MDSVNLTIVIALECSFQNLLAFIFGLPFIIGENSCVAVDLEAEQSLCMMRPSSLLAAFGEDNQSKAQINQTGGAAQEYFLFACG